MAIVLNQFADGVLTTAQLNALVNAITAKFNQGITTGDLASPLRLPGNLDMNHFEILHLAKLWNVRNLAERSSGTDFQAVLTEIGAAGGGVALLPADSTEVVGSTGVVISPNTILMGNGESSVFAASGTMSAAMIRNVAAGDTGIMIVNCKITGPASNDFDTVAFSRTVRAKFIDVKFENAQAAALVLSSNAAGSSCIDTQVIRCHFLTSSSADEAIFAQDLENLLVDGCTFRLGGTAITGFLFTAVGAASNCEDVTLRDNKFIHTAGSSAGAITMTAGSSTGMARVKIVRNHIEATAGACLHGMDIDGGTATPKASLDISDNPITGTYTGHGIRVRNCNGFIVDRNQLEITTGLGILIGATARSGSAATCRGYTVTSNQVTSGGSSFVFCHPGSGTMSALVSNNRGSCASGSTGEFEIWNLVAEPTTLLFDMYIVCNLVNDGSASAASWACYTGVGSTRGGQAGTANNSNLVFGANSAVNTQFGSTGAAEDFHDVGEPVTREYTHFNNIQ